MLAGRMLHSDNHGNSGELKPGAVQWMTAGRGIVHSEMPQQEEGLMWGFQLWVNLSAAEKMTTPRYQDITPEDVPVVRPESGVTVKVIAGHFRNTVGAVKGGTTAPIYLDVSLETGASVEVSLPESHCAFVYVFDGERAGKAEPLLTNRRIELRGGDDDGNFRRRPVLIRESEGHLVVVGQDVCAW